MDLAGHQLLARAALPLQDHRRVDLGQPLHPTHDLLHDRAGTDQPPRLLAMTARMVNAPPQAGDAERVSQHGQQALIPHRQAVIVETVVQEQLLHPGLGEQMRGGKRHPDHGAAGLAKERLQRLGGAFIQQHQAHPGRMLCIVTEGFLRRRGRAEAPAERGCL
ncbi:hypothetical protein D3C80_947980 [compost metagenome]